MRSIAEGHVAAGGGGTPAADGEAGTHITRD